MCCSNLCRTFIHRNVLKKSVYGLTCFIVTILRVHTVVLLSKDQCACYCGLPATYTWQHFHGLTSYGQLNSFSAERPKKKNLIPNHGFDSQAWRIYIHIYIYLIYVRYQVCTYEYEVRHTILPIKIAGWFSLEAAQTSLSNLLLLAVSYDIMLHFSRIVCPCFMQNKQIRLRWVQKG